MLTLFTIVLPVFGLIVAGFVTRRLGWFGASANVELSRFVVNLALPALLFDVTVHTDFSQFNEPGFMLAFGGAAAIVLALSTAVQVRLGRSLVDAAIDAQTAGYPNTGFLGLPLALLIFGREALPLATIGMILTVCAIFAAGVVTIEIGRSKGGGILRAVRTVVLSLLRNPLIVAPAVGAGLSALNIDMHSGVETFLTLLGGAASPCALVALGLFLAEPAPSGSVPKSAYALAVVKLAVQPALTFGICVLLRLDATVTGMAVMLAALPTGTGPFMLAQAYGRPAGVTSRVILVTTIVSVLTVPAWLALAVGS